MNTPDDNAPRPFTLCVYCGSRPGARAVYAEAARRVGRLIGERGWGLVYGGGRAGLMGTVADAALDAGARTVGVIPQSLMDREMGHRGLDELHVVQTMHQRKQMMAERADAFLALPGGIGTFEELFEVWTWAQLGYHDQPIGLLDVDGYYQPLLNLVRRAEAEGFMTPAQIALIRVDADAPRLLDQLGRRRVDAADDYSRI